MSNSRPYISNMEDLIVEWDYEKNSANNLFPNKLTAGSNKRASWICSKCGEKWDTKICFRGNVKSPTGCPYCSSPPLKAGVKNNLAVLFPEIAIQLDSGSDQPKAVDILPFSNKKYDFICDKGHKYNMVLAARTKQNQGCPHCNRQVSKLELRIFSELTFVFKDVKLRHRIDGIELDIFVPSINVGIEIDGHRWHSNKEENDRGKNRKMMEMGVRMMRVRERPLEKIDHELDIQYDHPCLYGEDFRKLYEQIALLLGVNVPNEMSGTNLFKKLLCSRGIAKEDENLKYLFPNVADLWSDDNYCGPDVVSPYSKDKYWWICESNHVFQATVGNMVAAEKKKTPSRGCPICSGRNATVEYNFSVCHPELLIEWDWEKNSIKPEELLPKSNKRVWWKCSNGHSWNAPIYSRVSGCGCLKCYRKGMTT